MKKILIGMVALGPAITATFGGAVAQDRYPSRSIKFVVPFVRRQRDRYARPADLETAFRSRSARR
jgi:hypothetical protein